MNSADFEARQRAAEERLKKNDKRYDELLRRSNELKDKHTESNLKKLRRQIINYAEDNVDDFQRQLKSKLEHRKIESVRTVRDFLKTNMGGKLQERRQMLEKLENDLKAEGEERDRKLALTEEQLKKSEELLLCGADLAAMLDAELNNTIEEQEL